MILVYGFEPWGFVSKNISKEIILELKKDKSLKQVEFIVLPVNEMGINCLRSYIKIKKPSIIMGLGHEALSRDFRIEQYAYSKANDKIESELAGFVALSLNFNISNRIGRFYCNKSYFTSLMSNRQSLFIHIGSRNENPTSKVKEVIKLCRGLR